MSLSRRDPDHDRAERLARRVVTNLRVILRRRPSTSALARIRTIQVCPKDAPTARRQAEDAVSWDSDIGAGFPGGETSCAT